MPAITDHVLGPATVLLWYARTLVSEVHSLFQRMRMLSQKRSHRPDPINLGPLYEEGPNGEIVPCKATFARSQYIEFLLARYPWATDADILLALDGWDKGTKCVLRNEDTARKRG